MVSIRWLGGRLEIIGGIVIFFSALFAVYSRIDGLSGNVVGLSVSYALQMTLVLSYLVRMFADMETNIVANERLEDYANAKKEADWITTPVVNYLFFNIRMIRYLFLKKSKNPLWPIEGNIQFKDYKVRYRENLDLILKGVTVDIKGGEKVGVVGRTGAGKSSLTLALFRYTPSYFKLEKTKKKQKIIFS